MVTNYSPMIAIESSVKNSSFLVAKQLLGSLAVLLQVNMKLESRPLCKDLQWVSMSDRRQFK